MKRLLIGGIAALALGLTGCSHAAQAPQPTAAPTTAPTTTESKSAWGDLVDSWNKFQDEQAVEDQKFVNRMAEVRDPAHLTIEQINARSSIYITSGRDACREERGTKEYSNGVSVSDEATIQAMTVWVSLHHDLDIYEADAVIRASVEVFC